MTRIHESGTEDVNDSVTTDQRRFKRKSCELTGRVSDGPDSFPVLVIDIWDGGAKIQVDGGACARRRKIHPYDTGHR